MTLNLMLIFLRDHNYPYQPQKETIDRLWGFMDWNRMHHEQSTPRKKSRGIEPGVIIGELQPPIT